MQPVTHAVFLAAGEGTRMRPLTLHVPKPLVRICGKNSIEHTFDILPETVTDVILVVHYLKEQIMNHFGTSFAGRRVHYVVQEERKGTGDALFSCKELLKGTERFLVCMGDDIYSAADMSALLDAGESAVLVKEVYGEARGGRMIENAAGHLIAIEEGVHHGTPDAPVRINAALYVLTPALFSYPLVPIKDGAEFGLPQTLVLFSREHSVALVAAREWISVTTFEDIVRAEEQLAACGRCAPSDGVCKRT